MPGKLYFRIFAGHLSVLLLLLGLLSFSGVYLEGKTATPLLFTIAAAVYISKLILSPINKNLRTLHTYLDRISMRIFGDPLIAVEGEEPHVTLSRARTMVNKLEKLFVKIDSEKRNILTIIESLDEGVILIDEEKRIIHHNSALLTIFGFKPDRKMSGKSVEEIIRVTKILVALDAVIETGRVVKKEVKLGTPMPKYLSVRIFPIAAENVKQNIVLVILNDITEQRKISQMRVDFVANASHELRTPLTSIVGFLETLEDGAINEPETATRFLGIIKKQTERLKRLTDDLLVLSNLELGPIELHSEEMELESLINSVKQVFMQTAQKKNVEIIHTLSMEVGIINTDRDILIQILLNLVDNAVKYSPKGGKVEIVCRQLRVDNSNKDDFDYFPLNSEPLLPETKGEWSKTFVEFSVVDTGEGIPPQDIPRLMERFYRVDNARSRELGGTGLGLSIVKHLIINLRGSIKIESEQGKYTQVRFIIPNS